MVKLRQIRDIDELLKWRSEVIGTVFATKAGATLMEANRRFYERHIADNSHVAFIASIEGKEVGCGAFCLTEELPSPENHSGRCAYLMNIYVREEMRRQGVGGRIVGRLVEEAHRRGCGKIYLESTDMARMFYQSLGFRPINMLRLEAEGDGLVAGKGIEGAVKPLNGKLIVVAGD